MVSVWIKVLLLVFFLAILLGYAVGRRWGVKQGFQLGISYGPLQLRRQGLQQGRCPICGLVAGMVPVWEVTAGNPHDITHTSLEDASKEAFQQLTPEKLLCYDHSNMSGDNRGGREVRFIKMHGLGNDYVYIDCVSQDLEANWPRLARAVSDRHTGVGSDGLILILPSDQADFRMRMFNADGSESEMCGNGIRCLAKYVYDHGLTEAKTVTVETLAGILTLELQVKDDRVATVRVDMGKPRLSRGEIPVAGGDPDSPVVDEAIKLRDGRFFRFTGVSMGNPHAVIFVPTVADFPVEVVGSELETHELFPQRANIEFVERKAKDELFMRVWERGSGETMACGTGACASAVAAALTGRTGRKVTVHLLGGSLQIEWAEDDHIYMTGPAVEVFSGEFAPDWLQEMQRVLGSE